MIFHYRLLGLLLGFGLLLTSAADSEAQRRQHPRQQQGRGRQQQQARQRSSERRQPAPPTRRAAPAAPQSRTAVAESDTSLRTTRVVIEQEYRPEIRRAPRPEFNPAPPPADTSRVAQVYEVPQQTLYYTYRSQPLRPLALGADTARPPYPSYLHFGGGNLSTVYGDLGLASLNGENFETTLHVRHLSQSGDLRGQQSSLTGLEAAGKLHGNGHSYAAGVDGLYNRYRYYGFDQQTFNYDTDTMLQTFKGLRLKAGVQNDTAWRGSWWYAPQVSVSYYGDSRGASERGATFELPVIKDLDSNLQLRLAVNGAFYRYRADSIARGNNLLQLVPAVRYLRGSFRAQLALSPTFGSGNSWLLPDLMAAYTIVPANVSIKAGWTASVQQNTYEELSTLNPYINSLYRLRLTRSDEIFVAGGASFAKYFSVDARVSYWHWAGLPLFTNNYNDMPDGRLFDVSYDGNLRSLALQLGMRYQVGEKVSIGGTGSWFDFYQTTEGRAWGQPGVRLKADADIRPFSRLRITAYVTVLDQIYAQNAAGAAVKLPAYVDLGAGASYRLIRRLGVFLQGSNLLARRNERWRGYASYGLNVYGGLSFHF